MIISFLAPSGTQFLGSDLCQPNAMLAVRSFNPAALAYERQGQSPCEDVVSLQLTWFVLLRALLHQLRMRLPTQPCLGERKARVRQLCTTSEPPTCISLMHFEGSVESQASRPPPPGTHGAGQGQSPCEDVVSLQLTWFVLLRALLHQLRMRLPTQPCLGERKARVRQLCTTSEPPTCIYILYICSIAVYHLLILRTCSFPGHHRFQMVPAQPGV